ncbi:MAG: isocitrate/isopropylmalate family dehydrogenase, partial [Mobilicoccus sp.]|nr:isocitrate/isopropylmalate family dehydrogenase [Mobilicoccus sp.]
QGKSDPTAAILSAAMLLVHVGRAEEARRIEEAVWADLAERGATPRSTTEIGDAIAARLR